MKFLRILGPLLISLGLAMPFVPLLSTASTQIHLTIITNDATLFDSEISVSDCSVPDAGVPAGHSTSTPLTDNAYCALLQAASSSNLSVDAQWSSFGVFVNSIGAYASDNAASKYWMWYSDNEAGTTALDAHTIHGGERITLAYGINPLRISASSSSPFVQSADTITAEYFDTIAFTWLPATTTTLYIDGSASSSLSVPYNYMAADTAPHILEVRAPGFITSPAITITAIARPSTAISLRIYTQQGPLFDGTSTVSSCLNASSSATGVYTLNGICAVTQAAERLGISTDVQWYSFGGIINSIGAFSGSPYWLWYDNEDMGAIGLESYLVDPDHTLTMSFGAPLLRVLPATTTPDIGSRVAVSVEYLDTDAYPSAWKRLNSTSTITIDGVATTTAGSIDYTVASSSEIALTASALGYVPSFTAHLFPRTSITTSSSTASTSPVTTNPAPPSSGSNGPIMGGGSPTTGGGGSSASSVKGNLAAAIAYLNSKQKSDGSFGASLYTDWAAIAYGASDITSSNARSLAAYLSSNKTPGDATTDLERRAMALQALGLDASTMVNSIKKAFDGTQFGNPDMVHDDIFAVFPLVAAGAPASDPMIIAAGTSITAKQSANGSWGDPDTTAAAIQALRITQNSGAQSAIAKARAYLKSIQASDGGFGNTPSSSWVLQALAALNEPASAWATGSHTPHESLAHAQALDGGFDSTLPADSRVWNTSYAIPAIADMPWLTILTKNQARSSASSSAAPAIATTDAATSTTPTTTLMLLATTSIPSALVINQPSNAPLASTSILRATTSGKIPRAAVSKTIRSVAKKTMPAPTLASPSTTPPTLAAAASALNTPEPVPPAKPVSFWQRIISLFRFW